MTLQTQQCPIVHLTCLNKLLAYPFENFTFCIPLQESFIAIRLKGIIGRSLLVFPFNKLRPHVGPYLHFLHVDPNLHGVLRFYLDGQSCSHHVIANFFSICIGSAMCLIFNLDQYSKSKNIL